MAIESGKSLPNTARLTACWPGDTVAHGEKRGLNLLYSAIFGVFIAITGALITAL
jgi:hypothetical protein